MTPLLIGDWFCGAGGSSVGIKAALDEMAIPHRIYAVNHWDRAIATHSANHADVEHRCVDLNAVDLRSLVPEGRLDVLWASPSCTEHSYAKGGKNIDDQKRASAWAVVHSIDAFRPKIVFVENVRERQSEASRFHRDVFAMFGGEKRLCSLCGKPGATDAAHVIARAHLGPLRYADPRFARPAHRECHERQERGEINFSLAIRRDAIRAHNAVAKIKLVLP